MHCYRYYSVEIVNINLCCDRCNKNRSYLCDECMAITMNDENLFDDHGYLDMITNKISLLFNFIPIFTHSNNIAFGEMVGYHYYNNIRNVSVYIDRYRWLNNNYCSERLNLDLTYDAYRSHNQLTLELEE